MEAEGTEPWYSLTVLISVTAPGVPMHTAASFGQNNAEECSILNPNSSALGRDFPFIMSSLPPVSYPLPLRRNAKLP